MKFPIIKVAFFVAQFLFVLPIGAQDIIITHMAQKIEAKVLEVSKSEIRYKEWDNLEGPTFVLGAEEVVTIIYANGKVVLYNQIESKGKKNKTNLANNSSSYGLDGRSIIGGLPLPSESAEVEGSVVVEIRVNKAGNVVFATCVGGTITDQRTIQLAIDAARKAKFTDGDQEQVGTITYEFTTK